MRRIRTVRKGKNVTRNQRSNARQVIVEALKEFDKYKEVYSKHDSTSKYIKKFIVFTFYLVGAFMALFAFPGLYFSIFKFNWSSDFNSVFTNIVSIVLFLFLGILSIVFFSMMRSIGKEKDRFYILSLFSALISILALIFAGVALFIR